MHRRGDRSEFKSRLRLFESVSKRHHAPGRAWQRVCGSLPYCDPPKQASSVENARFRSAEPSWVAHSIDIQIPRVGCREEMTLCSPRGSPEHGASNVWVSAIPIWERDRRILRRCLYDLPG